MLSAAVVVVVDLPEDKISSIQYNKSISFKQEQEQEQEQQQQKQQQLL